LRLRRNRQAMTCQVYALRLPEVDVEFAGVAKPDLFSRDVRLLRKEHVSGFYFGHNIRVSLDFPTMDGFASDHLTDLEDVRGGALKADCCVSWLHVTLKPIEFLAALHDLSLRLRRLRVGVLPHMHYGNRSLMFQLWISLYRQSEPTSHADSMPRSLVTLKIPQNPRPLSRIYDLVRRSESEPPSASHN